MSMNNAANGNNLLALARTLEGATPLRHVVLAPDVAELFELCALTVYAVIDVRCGEVRIAPVSVEGLDVPSALWMLSDDVVDTENALRSRL